MRFELTRENPNGLAGHRLNHSAKVSRTIDFVALILLKVESFEDKCHVRCQLSSKILVFFVTKTINNLNDLSNRQFYNYLNLI